MQIRSFTVSNYTSISHLVLEGLQPVNVLAGRNSTGKSNILDAIRFLGQVASGQFSDAVSTRGGFEEIIHAKNPGAAFTIETRLELSDQDRADILAPIGNITPQRTFLREICYSLTCRAQSTVEEFASPSGPGGRPRSIGKASYGRPSGHWQVMSVEQFGRCAIGEEPTGLVSTGEFQGSWDKLGLFRDLVVGGNNDRKAGEVLQGLYIAVMKVLVSVRWLGPVRRPLLKTPVAHTLEIQEDGGNLAAVLHTIHNGNRDLFERLETEASAVLPGLGQLHTPLLKGKNESTLTVRESLHGSRVDFDLGQISSGTRSVITMLTRVLTAPPSSIVCIEEPEAHLHPDAQERLVGFLKREARNKTIILSTHSPVIASSADLESVFLVYRDSESATNAKTVSPNEVAEIIRELGIKPSYNFEADAIVFVEGEFDVPVFEEWSRKRGLGPRVQFIDANGWNNMTYYANAKVLRRGRSDVQIFVVFDGDLQRGGRREKAGRRIAELGIPQDHIFTLTKSELEGYLLEAHALLRAFPPLCMKYSASDLDRHLSKFAQRRDQKKVLDGLLQENSLGRYDISKALMIAKSVDPIHADIDAIFKKVQESLKS